MSSAIDDVGHITHDDLHLFNEGTHYRLFRKLGSHVLTVDGVAGVHFAVWAPNARAVSVIGDFNGWTPGRNALRPLGDSGVWIAFFPGLGKGARYKYHVESRYGGYSSQRADPFALHAEVPPGTASIIWDLEFAWGDGAWLEARRCRSFLHEPVSIYEVHLGSWRRVPEEGDRFLTYRELAPLLVEHVRRAGFTHVELLPVMEHPFYGSWGYEVTGYFAPTSRHGTPQDFMYLIDRLHQAGIGVILDWVPAHFPSDGHALAYFDGSHLYEHADPRKGFHPDWHSSIFNYGRNEVRSFLLSSAIHWLETYHADGLRIDGVASMLYLDYSRKGGEWIPNRYGGRENIEAIDFLRKLNEVVYGAQPSVFTVAEESTAWPVVSRPTYLGGLGFGAKWDMGWMHDTLEYLSRDPLFRKYHHGQLTFRLVYAFTENFVLPLSHDEVVHGKGSLIDKMPGDAWQKRAGLRSLLAYMYAQPGKKLLFMGGEFGQWREWDHDASLDWHLLEQPEHEGILRWVSDLNAAYRGEPALHHHDFGPEGFEWIDGTDTEQSVLSFLRKGRNADEAILVVCNFTAVPRYNYRVGVPRGGFWREFLNSDAKTYGGSGHGNLGGVHSAPLPFHGRPASVNLTLPPMGTVFLKWEGRA